MLLLLTKMKMMTKKKTKTVKTMTMKEQTKNVRGKARLLQMGELVEEDHKEIDSTLSSPQLVER